MGGERIEEVKYRALSGCETILYDTIMVNADIMHL